MPWYCLTTPPSREILCAGALEAAGFSAVLPLDYRLRRRSPITHTPVVYAVPAMPRYVPVEIANPDWPGILRLEAKGQRVVTDVLRMDGKPYVLPSLAVSEVRSMVLERLAVPLSRGLRVGDTVIIEDGPFAGQRATVKRLHRKSARVLLNLFGALREADVKREYLSECGEKAAA